ncbi:hypothetical protein G7054_g2236 [Neopestalotiopsis clavispora]|nr:hypothetical protein G7054_g2236 [Neopestalotiopsis clavispora]
MAPRYRPEGDEFIFQLMEGIHRDEQASAGFRWHALATQDNQDRILKAYERFLRLARALPSEDETNTLSQRDKDPRMFPTPAKNMLEYLRRFVIFVAQETSWKSIDSEHLSYMGLVKYRL